MTFVSTNPSNPTIPQPIKDLITQITKANATALSSSQFLESLGTKAVAVIAMLHPGVNVAHWEPVIVYVSLAAVVVESGVRVWLSTHSLSAALRAAQAALLTPSDPTTFTPPPTSSAPPVA